MEAKQKEVFTVPWPETLYDRTMRARISISSLFDSTVERQLSEETATQDNVALLKGLHYEVNKVVQNLADHFTNFFENSEKNVFEFRSLCAQQELQIDALRAFCMRKDKAVDYMRKTLWQEVTVLRDELHCRNMDPAYHSGFVSMFDYYEILEGDDPASASPAEAAERATILLKKDHKAEIMRINQNYRAQLQEYERELKLCRQEIFRLANAESQGNHSLTPLSAPPISDVLKASQQERSSPLQHSSSPAGGNQQDDQMTMLVEEIGTRDAAIRDLQETIARLEREIQATEGVAKGYRDQLERMSSEIEDVSAAKDKDILTKTQLLADMEKKYRESETARAQASLVASKFEKAQQELLETSADFRSSQRELRAVKECLEESEKTVAYLQSELDKLRSHNSDNASLQTSVLYKKLIALEEVKAELADKLQEEMDKTAFQASEIEQLSAQYKAAMQENAAMLKRLDHVESSIATTSGDAANAVATAEEQTKTIDHLLLKVDDQRVALEDKDKVIKSLETLAADLTQRLSASGKSGGEKEINVNTNLGRQVQRSLELERERDMLKGKVDQLLLREAELVSKVQDLEGEVETAHAQQVESAIDVQLPANTVTYSYDGPGGASGKRPPSASRRRNDQSNAEKQAWTEELGTNQEKQVEVEGVQEVSLEQPTSQKGENKSSGNRQRATEKIKQQQPTQPQGEKDQKNVSKQLESLTKEVAKLQQENSNLHAKLQSEQQKTSQKQQEKAKMPDLIRLQQENAKLCKLVEDQQKQLLKANNTTKTSSSKEKEAPEALSYSGPKGKSNLPPLKEALGIDVGKQASPSQADAFVANQQLLALKAEVETKTRQISVLARENAKLRSSESEEPQIVTETPRPPATFLYSGFVVAARFKAALLVGDARAACLQRLALATCLRQDDEEEIMQFFAAFSTQEAAVGFAQDMIRVARDRVLSLKCGACFDNFIVENDAIFGPGGTFALALAKAAQPLTLLSSFPLVAAIVNTGEVQSPLGDHQRIPVHATSWKMDGDPVFASLPSNGTMLEFVLPELSPSAALQHDDWEAINTILQQKQQPTIDIATSPIFAIPTAAADFFSEVETTPPPLQTVEQLTRSDSPVQPQHPQQMQVPLSQLKQPIQQRKQQQKQQLDSDAAVQNKVEPIGIDAFVEVEEEVESLRQGSSEVKQSWRRQQDIWVQATVQKVSKAVQVDLMDSFGCEVRLSKVLRPSPAQLIHEQVLELDTSPQSGARRGWSAHRQNVHQQGRRTHNAAEPDFFIGATADDDAEYCAPSSSGANVVVREDSQPLLRPHSATLIASRNIDEQKRAAGGNPHPIRHLTRPPSAGQVTLPSGLADLSKVQQQPARLGHSFSGVNGETLKSTFKFRYPTASSTPAGVSTAAPAVTPTTTASVAVGRPHTPQVLTVNDLPNQVDARKHMTKVFFGGTKFSVEEKSLQEQQLDEGLGRVDNKTVLAFRGVREKVQRAVNVSQFLSTYGEELFQQVPASPSPNATPFYIDSRPKSRGTRTH